LASVGEGRRGRDGNATCEEKIGVRRMPSVVEKWNYIVYSISVCRGVVMEKYSIEYFRGYRRWLQALSVVIHSTVTS